MTDIGSLPESELDRLTTQTIERMVNVRYTFTEDEALRPVWEAGYEVTADSDPRFALVQESDGSHPRQWRLETQAVANDLLLDVLRTGGWDGRDLGTELERLGHEDGIHYVFCPTDSRFRLRQGRVWEPSDEVQVSLPEDIRTTLDTLGPELLQSWKGDSARPWTVRRITEVLSDMGWPEASEGRNWLLVRSWLCGFPAVTRVGADYWVPADSVPEAPRRRALTVVPLRHPERALARAGQEHDHAPQAQGGLEALSDDDALIPLLDVGASVASTSSTVTLRTINVIEGFLPVTARVRWMYPARPADSGPIEVLRGKWFDTGDDLWLWLDRADNRLYGPDLADQLAWCSPGERIQVDWAADVLVLRTAGIDSQVQEEEVRLVDPDALRKLRGGVGETYRESLVAILKETPAGLTFPEVVGAVRDRQLHTAHRGTIRTVLSAGGFVQRGDRWFVGPDAEDSARHLRLAIGTTYLSSNTDPDDPGAIIPAIGTRLHEIVEMLRRSDSAG